MTWTKVLSLLALCLVLTLALGTFVDGASAQVGGDRDLAGRDGTELAPVEFDRDRLPGKLEVGLAIGSIIAMIAVVKWL